MCAKRFRFGKILGIIGFTADFTEDGQGPATSVHTQGAYSLPCSAMAF